MRGMILAIGAVVAVGVLLLIGIVLSVEFGLAGAEDYEAGAPMIMESRSADLTLRATLDPDNPAVSFLPVLTGQLLDSSGAAVENVTYVITAYHLEDEKDMTKISFLAPDGTFSWSYQFFDGAPHRLTVAAAPAEGGSRFDSLQVESEIEVFGFGPPLAVKIKTTAYLLLVVLAGMIVGLLVRGKFSRRSARLPNRSEGEQAA